MPEHGILRAGHERSTFWPSNSDRGLVPVREYLHADKPSLGDDPVWRQSEGPCHRRSGLRCREEHRWSMRPVRRGRRSSSRGRGVRASIRARRLPVTLLEGAVGGGSACLLGCRPPSTLHCRRQGWLGAKTAELLVRIRSTSRHIRPNDRLEPGIRRDARSATTSPTCGGRFREDISLSVNARGSPAAATRF